MKVKILQFEGLHSVSEIGQVRSIDPGVVLVRFRKYEIKVTAHSPRTCTGVPDNFKFFQEKLLGPRRPVARTPT
jgi:hypothetical protein